MRLKFRCTAIAGACAAAVAIATAFPAQASSQASSQAAAASSPGWRVVYTHHYGPATNYSGYTDVAAVSPTDIWVLGGTDNDGEPAPGNPVAVQWNGRKWSTWSMPAGTQSSIFFASVVSAKSIWAVSDGGGYIVHWNGSRWTLAEHLPPGPAGEGPLVLSGVTAVNDSDVWVFGTSPIGPGYGTWHYNGHTWTHVTGDGGQITSASASSAANVWGIGTSKLPSDLLLRYNGKAWQNVTPKALAGNTLFKGTLAQSATSVWITTGSYTSNRAGLIHYSDGHWYYSKLPTVANDLQAPLPDGSGGFWVQAEVGGKYWLWHRSATGKWREIPVGFAPFGFAPVPKTATLIAPSWAPTKTGANAVVWAYGVL